MANFKVESKNKMTVEKKPRVYFTCHPEDFERYFAKIRDDIFKTHDCAIYYTEDMTEVIDEENKETDLERSNLFVVPVTLKLLTTPNRAMDEDVPYAFQKHIPVLPIMLDSGIDELYSKADKFGELQYLNPNSKDSTEIPYEEKLKKYLDSVLISDEMAKRVRDAFDAYIFLSYRKKDRKYANALMRLIHSHSECRDIAIWFDEFLTPGESFKASIDKILSSSKLFTLLVTPNLLEEPNGKPNFVMGEEYPTAKKSGIRILPAEMVETDKNALSEKYEGIPECMDPYMDNEFKQVLLDSVTKLATKASDIPEHNFLIGLAYLDGIDVEVNREYALELISGAADAGLLEAAEKMVDMYQTGVGVERNYHTAAGYQEKVCALYEEIYNEDSSSDNLHNLVWALFDCGNMYEFNGLIDRAKSQYQRADAVMQASLVPKDDQYLRNLAINYDMLGNACKAEGDMSMARKYYEKGLEISRNLAEKLGTVEALRDFAISCNNLGIVCKAERDLPAAREYYEKYFEISLKIVETAQTEQAVRDLIISYSNLGGMYYLEGDLPKARECYEKVLQSNKLFADIAKTIESYRDLSISYWELGSVCEAEGNLAGARDCFAMELEISKKIAEEIKTMQAFRDFAISYCNIGNICILEGNLTGARNYYEKGLEILQKLAEDTEIVEILLELSAIYEKLGDICNAEDNLTDAREFYGKSLKIRERLAQEVKMVEVLRGLAVSYERHGNICEAEENLSDARYYYEKGFKITQKLVEETNTVEAIRDMSVSYYNLGSVCEAEGNLSEARAYYEKVLEISLKLAEETKTPESYDDLAMAYYSLASVDYGRKKQFLEKAIEIYEMLTENYPQVAAYRVSLEEIKSAE